MVLLLIAQRSESVMAAKKADEKGGQRVAVVEAVCCVEVLSVFDGVG